MKHQRKTCFVVWLIAWMVFAYVLGKTLFGHIIAFVVSFGFIYLLDRYLTEYESELSEKRDPK